MPRNGHVMAPQMQGVGKLTSEFFLMRKKHDHEKDLRRRLPRLSSDEYPLVGPAHQSPRSPLVPSGILWSLASCSLVGTDCMPACNPIASTFTGFSQKSLLGRSSY